MTTEKTNGDRSEDITKFNVEQFCDYLALKFDEDVVESFRANKITGSIFLQLSEEQVGKIVKAIGDVVQLLNIQAGFLGTVKPCASVKVEKALPSNTMSGRNDWLSNFKVPTSFSFNTMKALESNDKSRITSTVRREIIYHLSTLAVVHTREPTKEEYSQLCEMLIKKHPILADNWGTGYGSWRDRLITRFKNIRKDRGGKEKDKSSESSGSSEPPAKKCKTSSPNEKPSEFLAKNISDQVSLSEAEYNDKVKELKEESSKSRRKSKIMGELIIATFSNRRKWILEQYPPIREILEKYPFLQLERWLRREFQLVTGIDDRISSLVTEWIDIWQYKLLEYMKKEAESSSCLAAKMAKVEDDTLKCIISLEHLLYPRSQKIKSSILHFCGEATDADEEADRCGRKEPFVMICETDESCQYIVYVEKECLVSTKTVVDAVADLICAYFVFDLVYPKNIYPMLIFLQHTMMGIKDVEKLSTSVMTLLSSLSSEI